MLQENFMLKDKVAVVTGGSRGIGAAIAETFAQNGASVAILYRGNAEKADETAVRCRAHGVEAEAYPCDVSDADATAAVFKQILERFGTIDILVNNAGITRDGLLMRMKEADFDQVLDTNLKGAFLTIKQVYPIFLKKRSGKIINISSVSGLRGNAGQANYSSSKAGLIGLTKTVAKELISRGVCCNAIAPGFIETDMTQALTTDDAWRGGVAVARAGKPEDVANAALFLASSMADYITGEVIRVDGGLAI